MGAFPIAFKALSGLTQIDDTDKIEETLNKLTPLITDIFNELQAPVNKSPRAL